MAALEERLREIYLYKDRPPMVKASVFVGRSNWNKTLLLFIFIDIVSGMRTVNILTIVLLVSFAYFNDVEGKQITLFFQWS